MLNIFSPNINLLCTEAMPQDVTIEKVATSTIIERLALNFDPESEDLLINIGDICQMATIFVCIWLPAIWVPVFSLTQTEMNSLNSCEHICFQ